MLTGLPLPDFAYAILAVLPSPSNFAACKRVHKRLQLLACILTKLHPLSTHWTLLPVLLLLDRLPVYLPAVLVCLLNAQVTALWCVYC